MIVKVHIGTRWANVKEKRFKDKNCLFARFHDIDTKT